MVWLLWETVKLFWLLPDHFLKCLVVKWYAVWNFYIDKNIHLIQWHVSEPWQNYNWCRGSQLRYLVKCRGLEMRHFNIVVFLNRNLLKLCYFIKTFSSYVNLLFICVLCANCPIYPSSLIEIILASWHHCNSFLSPIKTIMQTTKIHGRNKTFLYWFITTTQNHQYTLSQTPHQLSP